MGSKKLKEKQWPIRLEWKTELLQFALTIKDGPYSGGSSRSYDTPKALKANPVYSRLRKKSDQVREGKGLRGIILCDGGYSAFSGSLFDQHRIDALKISHSFLEDSPDVDFVVLIWVEEKSSGWDRHITRAIRHETVQKATNDELSTIIAGAVSLLPQPKRTGRNARNHLGWRGRNMGFGGGFTMAWPRVKISSTMLLNLLSGRISVEEFNDRLDWTSGTPKLDRRFLNVFERALREGKLPTAVTIESSPNDDDDWMIFEFGAKDAAISSFTGRIETEN